MVFLKRKKKVKERFCCREGPLRFEGLPDGESECLGYPREEKKGSGQHQKNALDGYRF